MQIATDPVDVQDLQFKLQCRLKIFDRTEGNPIKNTTNLVASASRFGLIFVGCNSPKLKVVRYASIEDYPSCDAVGNYSRREITLPSVPEHISVNCDHTKLAVILEKDNCPVVQFYNVQSFVSQNVQLLNEARLSTTPNVKVLVANWHPTIDNIFTECKTDGSLGVYELKGNSVDINKLPAEANVTCFCWSPKGKQIAVGSKDGKLTHYKPDLKAVKVINAPPFEKPYSIISLQWISNYQFIGVFKPVDTSDDQCCLVLIDAPKTGNTTFTNFYDVCYSNGNYRVPQFYLLFEQHWNILIVSSANSMEIGVLAANGESWTQWTLPDTARAELPLDENREETYPVGLAIDTSSVKPIPWGESTLQPAPSLLLLSHQGVLCSFKIINLRDGVPSINSPPENIADLSGLGAFTTGSTVPKPTQEMSKIEAQVPSPFSVQPSQQTATPNAQVQKEASLPFSSAASTPQMSAMPQFSFLTPQVTIQPIQKPTTPVTPQATSSNPTSLFGPQITVTSNKGNTNSSGTSLIGSMLLNAANTSSTPLSVASVANSVASRPSQQFSFSSIEQPQPVAIVANTQEKSKSELPDKSESQNVALPSETPTSNQSEPQESNEEIEKIFSEMIQMECAALEHEIQTILYQGGQVEITLKPEDIDIIEKRTKDIDDFIKEVFETCESQKSEIHILKQNTIQSWAWFEEAKSKYQELQNGDMKALWKMKPLDSVSEKHLETLKQMEYYLNSQLTQAHKALDEQWDDFQDFCRKATRTPMPTMEKIFQTMVKQNVILQRQECSLKDIQRQVKARKKKPAQKLVLDDENSLEVSFQNMDLDSEDIHRLYQQRVLKRFNLPTAEVSNQIRKILESREPQQSTVKSRLGRSILQTPPQRKIRSISQQMTPGVKNVEVPRNLNFFQSTPIEIKSKLPSAPTAQIPSTPLSAFASTFNVPSPKIENLGENSTSKIMSTPISLAPSEASSTEVNFMKPVSTNEPIKTSNGLNFGGFSNFGKEASLPPANLSFGVQSSASHIVQNNQFTVSKPPVTISTTANVTSSAGIFSSFHKIATPEISGSVFPISSCSTAVSSTLSFGNTPSSLGSSEKTLDLTVKNPEGANITSFLFNKAATSSVPSSSDSTTFTQSTKGSFFTPITSAQFTTLSSLQQPLINSNSSAKTSAFAPITTASSSLPVTTSAISTAGITFGFDKTSSVSSNSSTSSVTSSVIAAPAVPKSSSFNIANIISSSSSMFGAGSNVSSTTQTGSIFGPTSVPSSGFSFASGSKSSNATTTNESRPLFGSGTTPLSSDSVKSQISSTTTTTATITNSNANLLGVVSTTSNILTSPTTTTETSGSIFGSIITTTTGNESVFKAGSTPSSSTPTLIESASTANTSPPIFNSSSTAASSSVTSSVFGTSSLATCSDSVFGSSPATTSVSSSFFGTSAASTTSKQFGNIASTAQSPVSSFGTVVPATITSSSLFGSIAPSTTTSASLFGTAASSTTSSSSLFGSTAPSSASSGSLFGTAASTTSSTSLFGTPTTSSGSLFGTAVPATTISGSLFGAKVPETTSSGSLFGMAVPASTSSGSLFGKAVPTTTSSGSLFGTGATSTTNSGSIFGSAGSSTTTSGSLFGTGKIFGGVAPASTSDGSMFGAASPETTKSVFGSSSASSQSVFGTSTTSSPFAATSSFGASTTTTPSSSIFGNSTNSPAPFGGGTSAFGSVNSSNSPFGTPTSSAAGTFGGAATFGGSPFANSGSPFGAVATSSVSPFGNTATSSASPFGAAPNASPFTPSNTSTSPFVKPSAFGQSSTFGSGFGATPATSSSIFGQATSSPSIFGSATTSNVFGGTTTTSTFGNASSPFGSASSAGATSPFGQAAPSGGFFGSSQSVFGSSANNENTGTSFGFGSLNVGASTQSPFAKTTETKSPFGSSTFSTTSSSGSLFGSSSFGNAAAGGSVFGQSTFGNTFGNNQQTSGPFSSGGGSVSQSGFGAAPAFQKPTGFGAQPAFGGSPAFGSAPSFGGSPSFGGNATFGSPTNKVFGSTNQTGVFGSNTQQQQSSAFGNMSNQNTVGFGNLVQQSANSGQNAPFSGNSSFSSWR